MARPAVNGAGTWTVNFLRDSSIGENLLAHGFSPLGRYGPNFKVAYGAVQADRIAVRSASVASEAGASALRTESALAEAAENEMATVFRVQPRGSSDIVTGGAFRRSREAGANLVDANARRRALMAQVDSADPVAVRRALVDAQASGAKSPFISTTFDESGALQSLADLRAKGIDAELLTIRGPRAGGVDFNAAFEALGGRTKRFQDAALQEFGIRDLFIPARGKSRSGFEIIMRR
jgi:hypothetical protein